jgi:hypothetical protein
VGNPCSRLKKSTCIEVLGEHKDTNSFFIHVDVSGFEFGINRLSVALIVYCRGQPSSGTSAIPPSGIPEGNAPFLSSGVHKPLEKGGLIRDCGEGRGASSRHRRVGNRQLVCRFYLQTPIISHQSLCFYLL